MSGDPVGKTSAKPVKGTVPIGQSPKKITTQKAAETIDVQKRTSACLATMSLIAKAQENAENLRATDKEKYDRLQKVYKNSTITYMDNGNVQFTINADMSPEDFKQAYGIDEGALREYLQSRHNQGMENGTVDAVPQGNLTTDQTILAYNAEDPGATIEFTDGLKYTKARRRFWGDIYNHRDFTNMKLETGNTFTIYPSQIKNK